MMVRICDKCGCIITSSIDAIGSMEIHTHSVFSETADKRLDLCGTCADEVRKFVDNYILESKKEEKE